MKRLLIITLLIGFAAPMLRAQCWLSAEELTVKALGGETLTIGQTRPAMSETGRTVCYKWEPNQYITESSNLNAASVSVHMPNTDGAYYFHVKRISEDGVQHCTITVNVEETFSIVSITPHYQCWNEGDAISEDQFDIVTEPAGMEGYVSLDANSRSAQCHGLSGSIAGTCDQPLGFTARKGSTIVDSKTISIPVYKANDAGRWEISGDMSESSIPGLNQLLKNINSAGVVANKIANVGNKLASKINEWVPGNYIQFDSVSGNITAAINGKASVCCQGKANQKEYGFGVTGAIGFGVSANPPARVVLAPIIPPAAGIPDAFKIHFGVSVGASVGFTATINSCLESQVDIPVELSLTGSIGGRFDWEWTKFGKCHAQLVGFMTPTLTGTIHAVPWNGFEISGSVKFGFEAEAEAEIGWFKGTWHGKYTLCDIKLF